MDTQPQQTPRWPLTGRDSELEAFAKAWAKRRYQGVVIHGPAGVGKSRLAEECLARAVHEGWKAQRATASAAAAAVPLGAVAHLIPPGVDLSDPVKGFTAVATALAGPQRDRRWAVWVDDLHLLDATSAVLLRQLMDARVVRLIATVRDGEPVGEAVAALTGADTVHHVDLSAFDQQQAQAALEAGLGGAVGRRALHELYTASGGNVLYLHELALGARHTGALASDGEIWELTGDRPVGTPRLTELIQARLATAAPAAHPLLELLALTETLSLTESQQCAPFEVIAQLQESGLLQVTTSRRTTVQLAHPLYGEVLRAGIPALRRRTLLLQQADRIRGNGGRRRDDALHIAAWQLAATGTADPDLLVHAAALARHAHDYQRTVALLEAVPDDQHTAASLLLLGEACFELGQFAQAEQAFARADDLADDEGQRLAIVMDRTQSLFWGAGRTAEGLAVNAAVLANTTDPMLRKILEINEGCMRICSDDPVRGLELLHGIDEIPDPRVRLYGLALKSAGLQATGRAEEAAQLSEHAYAVHLGTADEVIIQTAAWHLIYAASAHCGAGHLARARAVADQAHASIVEEHAPLPQVWATLALAQHAWLAGHPADARRWFAEALAHALRHHLALALRLCASGLAASCAVLGDIARAEQALAHFGDYPHHTVYWEGQERLGEAWLLAARGRLGEARAVLNAAARTARDRGHVTSEALLLTDVARLGGAEDVRDRLAELAQHCDGAFAPARARFAAALVANDPDGLEGVADEMEAIGADLLAAEAATQAAAAWQRAGHARRAAAATQQAQACAERCQSARTPLLVTGQAAAVLTTREKEIALLAAAGTASKDIADTLHLSVRTVDNHLQRAYAKLGVTTRRELADSFGTPATHPRNPTPPVR